MGRRGSSYAAVLRVAENASFWLLAGIDGLLDLTQRAALSLLELLARLVGSLRRGLWGVLARIEARLLLDLVLTRERGCVDVRYASDSLLLRELRRAGFSVVSEVEFDNVGYEVALANPEVGREVVIEWRCKVLCASRLVVAWGSRAPGAARAAPGPGAGA